MRITVQCDLRIVSFVNRYDFDLKTGHSETGLKACTYATDIRTTEDGEEHIWVETPEEGSGWLLVEFRPVSEGVYHFYQSDCACQTVKQSSRTRLRLHPTFLTSLSPILPQRNPSLSYPPRTHQLRSYNGQSSSSIPPILC